MNIKKYDYLVNENGDVWMVDSVHRNGLVTITFTGDSGGEDDTIVYSAGQIDSWFRRLPGKDYSSANGYVDPSPYWRPVKKTVAKVRKAKKSRKSGSTASILGGMR